MTTPDFRILANADDVTARIRDRLLSLTITDNDGEKADRLELSLDDRDNRLEMPELDAVLEVELGLRGQPLHPMGRFAIEGVAASGPPDTIRITATAVDLKTVTRAPQTRAWEGQSFGEIARRIASEAGLDLVIAPRLDTVPFSYLAQTSESDLHFLTRLARGLDATAKAVAGKLVIAGRAPADQTAAGDDRKPVMLPRDRLTRWQFDLSGRGEEKSIEAEVQLTGSAERKRITAGSGKPARRLRHTFATEAEARRAAQSELARSARGKEKLEATLAGFEPALFAGGRVTLTGLRPETAGTWHITTVRHQLGTGLVTDFSANKGGAA